MPSASISLLLSAGLLNVGVVSIIIRPHMHDYAMHICMIMLPRHNVGAYMECMHLEVCGNLEQL